MASADMNTLRVVLLGKTGNGKSSLGNALIGGHDKELQVGRGLSSKTFVGEWRKRKLDDLTIEVVDTPGLCDTHLDDQTIYREVGKSVALAEPGPHVLIFTLRCDRRFTKEEWKAYRIIKEMFTSEMNKFMILVFNGLDELVDEKDKECSTIEQQRKLLDLEVNQFGGEVKSMLDEASKRYFGMNNKASATAKKQQIRDLINMMKNLRFSGIMPTTEEDTMDTRRDNEHRILVIGKSGNGKSSVCNTIVGDQRFRVGRGLSATTRTVQHELVDKYGRNIRKSHCTIQVVDTPDVDNTNLTHSEKEEEVARWRKETHPYPTAVLLTVRCDIRYTAEEYAIYRHIQRLWGDNSLQHRLVVAFTFGDCQDEPIEEELKTVCPELKSVLRDAENRYFVFSNKASNTAEQAAQLLNYTSIRKTRYEPPTSTSTSSLPRVLVGVAGVTGLFCTATVTYSKTRWAVGFGLLCFASLAALIVLKIKRKMN